MRSAACLIREIGVVSDEATVGVFLGQAACSIDQCRAVAVEHVVDDCALGAGSDSEVAHAVHSMSVGQVRLRCVLWCWVA